MKMDRGASIHELSVLMSMIERDGTVPLYGLRVFSKCGHVLTYHMQLVSIERPPADVLEFKPRGALKLVQESYELPESEGMEPDQEEVRGTGDDRAGEIRAGQSPLSPETCTPPAP